VARPDWLRQKTEACIQAGLGNVDHIHGGGNKEQTVLGNHGIYRKVLKISQPERQYQLLCANCNWIKRVENNEVKHCCNA
jgi:hypothetical protein